MPNDPRPRIRIRGRTKRLILLLLAYAVGGAIINVAVAWGLTIWVPLSMAASTYQSAWKGELPAGPISHRWNIFVIGGFGYCRVHSIRDPRLKDDRSVWPPDSAVPAWCDGFIEKHFASPSSSTLFVDARGWPMLSTWALGDAGSGQISYGLVWDSAVRDCFGKPFALPCRPIWPGFAINTIFYASMLWLLFAAPGLVRRRIRARRGQCPACAYPVGTSNICTECGRPV